MEIFEIAVSNDGYISCRSNFCSAQDFLSNDLSYKFLPGTNIMRGEIDSGNWAVSYLLSMYKHRMRDFILFQQPEVSVNCKPLPLCEFSELSCYMDRLYPLFCGKRSVERLIKQGLKRSKLSYSCNDVCKLFCLDSDRIQRSLNGVGNEIFRAMAAIGFSYGKEVFCFPWLSKRRFEYYSKNLSILLEILESLNKVVIVPIGE